MTATWTCVSEEDVKLEMSSIGLDNSILIWKNKV